MSDLYHRLGVERTATTDVGLNPKEQRRIKKAKRAHLCLECGNQFVPAEGRQAAFCCREHKTKWNNRRLKRGAEFYDLFMALRYERETAKEEGVWTTLTRLSQHYREQDEREREGRRSWQKPRAIRDRRPHLEAIVVHRGGRR